MDTPYPQLSLQLVLFSSAGENRAANDDHLALFANALAQYQEIFLMD
jgi:hypothetical protein